MGYGFTREPTGNIITTVDGTVILITISIKTAKQVEKDHYTYWVTSKRFLDH